VARTRLFVGAVCATVIMGFGASAALAGEVTGSGKPVTHTRAFGAGSICSFSGLEDWASPDPQVPEDGIMVDPGVTQHPAPGDLHGGDNACKGYASAGH
jgi:hypothetical protein